MLLIGCHYQNYRKRKDTMCNWISVKDRLPVAKEVVLAYESAFDSMSMAFRLPGTEEFINVGDYYALDAVTHWMPLPEPPEVTP
nr:MAG TPA: Protein of unknown function (DUF551) [Caudoviricetes sp.]